MSLRPTTAGLLFLTGTTACGPKLDPLLPMRAELAEARVKGPSTHPHLRFAIAESTALALVEQAAGLEKPRVFPLMMGAAAKIKVDIDEPALTVSEGVAGPHIDLGFTGSLDVTVSSILGNTRLADGLRFDAGLGGAVRFKLQQDGDDQLLMLRPVKRDPWKANVQLAEEKGFLTNKAVNKQLDDLFTSVFAKPTLIGRIPGTVPIRAAALRLLPDESPTAGAWLQARPTPTAPPIANPTEGWTLTSTDEAILMGARAAMAHVRQHPTWQVEPRELSVFPDRFEGVLRVHKVARKLKYRDYRVEGEIALDDELLVRAHTIEEISKHGFGLSLIGPFIKGRVRKEVMRIDLHLPAATEQPIGTGALIWTLKEIRRTDEGLFIDGDVSARPQEKT